MDADYNGKIVRVLKKLLEPDFKVKNDVYLNLLLTHLTSDPENGSEDNWRTVTKQYIPAWIVEAVLQWEKLKVQPPAPILSFVLNLASFVCRNEQIFVNLNCRNIYERLITLIKLHSPTTAPTIKLGYIKLVASFLEHKSGLQWIISTNYWADIMNLSLKNQTMYITKEGYKFIGKLLLKSIKLNEGFCCNVMQLIMAPINKTLPCTPPSAVNIMEVRDEAIYQSLCSTLSLLIEVLEILLESISSENGFKVLSLFKNKFGLEQKIKTLTCITHDEDFHFDLYKILFVLGVYEVYIKIINLNTTAVIECYDVPNKSSTLFEIFAENLKSGSVLNFIKLTHLGYIYWKSISTLMPICVKSANDPVPILFETQMLHLQLYPIIIVSFKMLGEREAEKRLTEDEVRDHYVDQIIRATTQPTMRMFFLWRNFLMQSPYVFDHGSLALNYVIKSKSMLNREQAVTAFQTLIYCLQDIINVLKQNPEQIGVFAKEYNYMALLLDAIAIYINEFTFTWRDSLESICVLSLSFDFLGIPTWPTKLVVKGLKLLDISISKYLTPNMALLIDNMNDSSMAGVGPMLYAKLHDSSWEVRDSALEVVCNISKNANKNFPSLRDIVLGADLSSLILRMSVVDGEAYVRASALKCLQEMVKVQVFWDNLLESGSIHEKIIQILQVETEGIVRSEAATLLVDIYDNREIPAANLSKYYDIMTHAATADLHWEVKVNALKFWEKVITHHLTHQGMIDGAFPKVTFSKEHRKIVTLNEVEVRKRLIKILNQLSETGCLAVLITALQDDCDLEVSKVATKITQDFVVLLKTYDIHSSDVNLSTPPSPLTPFNAVPSPPYSNTVPSVSTDTYPSMSPVSQFSDHSQNNCMNHLEDISDAILDEIMNSQDVNLLQSVYNADDQMSDNCLQLRFRRVTTASDFLKFVDTDFESHMNDKAKWLSELDAFGSLLDDILKEYDTSDVNSMDCY